MASKNNHYVYRIVHKESLHFYIGLRTCKGTIEDDPYMGSGTVINNYYKKYGKDVFSKEILHTFATREEASTKESELVNVETLKDPLCLNLKTGGDSNYSTYIPILKERTGSKNPNFGNHKKPSKEIIEKRQLAMKNSSKFQQSRKSEEYRSKISAIQSKAVVVFDTAFTINFEFKNCKDAAENLGVTRANISNAIRDKRMIGKKIKLLPGPCYVCYKENLEEYLNEIKQTSF